MATALFLALGIPFGDFVSALEVLKSSLSVSLLPSSLSFLQQWLALA
jgi:hypothetical protein